MTYRDEEMKGLISLFTTYLIINISIHLTLFMQHKTIKKDEMRRNGFVLRKKIFHKVKNKKIINRIKKETTANLFIKFILIK